MGPSAKASNMMRKTHGPKRHAQNDITVLPATQAHALELHAHASARRQLRAAAPYAPYADTRRSSLRHLGFTLTVRSR